jgi:hypothetical protein
VLPNRRRNRNSGSNPPVLAPKFQPRRAANSKRSAWLFRRRAMDVPRALKLPRTGFEEMAPASSPVFIDETVCNHIFRADSRYPQFRKKRSSCHKTPLPPNCAEVGAGIRAGRGFKDWGGKERGPGQCRRVGTSIHSMLREHHRATGAAPPHLKRGVLTNFPPDSGGTERERRGGYRSASPARRLEHKM